MQKKNSYVLAFLKVQKMDEKSEAIFQEDLVSELARKAFNIQALLPIQRYVIANILDGINQLVVLPTGMGKSICFQLSALLLSGVTLIVVPLLSLLQDQLRRLKHLGIQADVLQGGQTTAERQDLAAKLAAGKVRLLYATPEALLTVSAQRLLAETTVAHLVIDEAHCACEWGKSFRPAYRKLPQVLKGINKPLITAFTATASPEIIEDLANLFFATSDWRLLNEAPERPNLVYQVKPVLSKSDAISRLAKSMAKPLVVFCRSRASAELTARLLRYRLNTSEVFFYHAGLNRQERQRVESWFFQSQGGILCATSAYGMGVDKPDIRSVIHRELPPSLEAYLQESGRAGRDGFVSKAVLLDGYEDYNFLANLATETARLRYQAVLAYARQTERCRRLVLLEAFGHQDNICNKDLPCDICAGEYVGLREGEEAILETVARHKRLFTTRQLVALFKGGHSYLASKERLSVKQGFGLLADWATEDIEEALKLLVSAGKLKLPRRGPFKEHYSLKRHNLCQII